MSQPDDSNEPLPTLEAIDSEFEPTRVGGAQHIGRYELVYELGTGGMASVFLARAAGPAGFHKWFAIKRIHPHLAKDRRFVDMFLDEARIAASLQHPNVAHVFDLGQEDGEYFIAMEYLHGEHLGSLAVRVARELGRLSAEIAAHLVARAADGLHHAHEARGPDGQPLHLVHRDVSPQNLFITYDGTVRITDFGIAKAAGRLTHTETGSTKGKTAYMSPEQALGTAIDRRADIFALGIVLWELTVGRRLFKTNNPASTVLRIASGRTPPPSMVIPGYPQELEQIVMRALAHKPEHRYPTAAALARDLDRFVASCGVPAGAPELSALMQRFFGDRLRAKEDLLRAEPGTLVDMERPPYPAGEDSVSGAIAREQSHSEIVRRPPPRSRAVLPLALLAIALVAGVGIGAVILFSGGGGTVRVDSDPSGARVSIDGRHVGNTPAVIRDVDPGRHQLALTLDGFAPFSGEFDAEEGRTDLSYRLAAVSGSPSSTPSPSPTPSPTPSPSPSLNPTPTPTPTPSSAPVAEAPRREVVRGTGYLNLITVPWASVTVNGRSAGNTPLVRRAVPAGPVTIVLRPEGRSPARTLRLRVAPGETLSRSVNLR